MPNNFAASGTRSGEVEVSGTPVLTTIGAVTTAAAGVDLTLATAGTAAAR